MLKIFLCEIDCQFLRSSLVYRTDDRSQDGCQLVLPYSIGENGHARRSDGSSWAIVSTDLFQQGYNPFIKGHDVQLKFVLRRWAELVETGAWEVDANGVRGGIEKWHEADSAEHWHRYQLPIHW